MTSPSGDQAKDGSASIARIVTAAAPVAGAIAVFGVVYGAGASAEFGPFIAVVSSLVIFSGTVQFAVLGLLASGAGLGAALLTVIALNARNLVLGSVLRPRLLVSRARRALLGWFLIDETFGLAIAMPTDAARVLAVSGTLCFLAWQLGTILGVAGARVVALEGIATAIFPVLFVGLAAVAVRVRSDAVRAIAAGAAVLVLSLLVPSARPFLPVVAALGVALAWRRS